MPGRPGQDAAPEGARRASSPTCAWTSTAQQLAELGIEPFDLVVVNLYPFRETVASGALARRVRRADRHRRARRWCAPPPRTTRRWPSSPARQRTPTSSPPSQAAASTWPPASGSPPRRSGTPPRTTSRSPPGSRSAYAPRRRARGSRRSSAPPGAADTPALRREPAPGRRALHLPAAAPAWPQAEQLHGKEMSYNNYVDTDAACRAAYDHDRARVAVIKHANPCGIAVGADVAEAHRKAHACDPLSAVRRRHRRQPAGDRGDGRAGRRDLHRGHRRPGLRGRRARGPATARRTSGCCAPGRPGRARSSSGRSTAGCWCRSRDRLDADGDDPADWTLATGERADAAELARPGVRLAGLPRGRSPTRSCSPRTAPRSASAWARSTGSTPRKLAVERAGEERARGAVAASDAFFPFPDGLEVLLDAGVRAVVQPGGSVRDEEVVEAAAAAGVTMYLTGTRHFFH